MTFIYQYFNKKYEVIKHNTSFFTPFHNDINIIGLIIDKLKNTENFIETGICHGFTSFFIAKNFQNINVYGCEADEETFKTAVALIEYNIGDINLLKNLKVELKKSPESLYDLEKIYGNQIYTKNTMFWLDAHDGSISPLFEELSFITKKFKNFMIIIDDFSNPFDNKFTNEGFNIKDCINYIYDYKNRKDEINIYLPFYSEEKHYNNCNNINNNNINTPVGYCIITTDELKGYDFLIQIKQV